MSCDHCQWIIRAINHRNPFRSYRLRIQNPVFDGRPRFVVCKFERFWIRWKHRFHFQSISELISQILQPEIYPTFNMNLLMFSKLSTRFDYFLEFRFDIFTLLLLINLTYTKYHHEKFLILCTNLHLSRNLTFATKLSLFIICFSQMKEKNSITKYNKESNFKIRELVLSQWLYFFYLVLTLQNYTRHLHRWLWKFSSSSA